MNLIDLNLSLKLGQIEELKSLRVEYQKLLEELKAQSDTSKIKPLFGCYFSSSRHSSSRSTSLRIRSRKGFTCPNGKSFQYIREADIARICAQIAMAREIEDAETAIKYINDGIKRLEQMEIAVG
jgi:hypothetical protein